MAKDEQSCLTLSPIAPAQLRAARGMLGWSRSELAKRAGTSAETIKNIEHGIYAPKKETLAALVKALLLHGIQFVHYETFVTVPAENGKTGELQTISYVGAVRATTFTPEIKEEGNE